MKSINKKLVNLTLALFPFIFIIVIWHFIYVYNVFPQWLIPYPTAVVKSFWALVFDGTIGRLILISALNVIPPFLIALVVSLILGVFIGINTVLKKMFFPLLSAIYLVPSLAWLPLIILFLGFTREALWSVVFISSFMKIIYNVIAGVRSIDQNWILAAKNIGLGKIEVLFKVIIPGALPHIITGIRLGFGSSWRSLIAAEMLVVALGGLGKFIWLSQWYFSFDKVIVGIVVIALIGLVIEQFVFGKLERKTLIRWGLIREDL